MEAVIEGGFYQKGTDDDFDDQALGARLAASMFSEQEKGASVLSIPTKPIDSTPIFGFRLPLYQHHGSKHPGDEQLEHTAYY